MIVYTDHPQGSEAWLEARRAVITGSHFKVCRGKLKGGAPDKACLAYAMDTARERVGGAAPSAFVNAAMRFGTAEEPIARIEYIAATGLVVEEVGFAYTEDRRFGCSVDGLVGEDGIIEIKTMVSSDTLFKAMVDGDISEYVDQCNGAMWLLGRQWVDLVLWAPDLTEFGCALTIVRIERDDNAINELEADLVAFERMVSQFEAKLRAKAHAPTDTPPWDASPEIERAAARAAELVANPFA